MKSSEGKQAVLCCAPVKRAEFPEKVVDEKPSTWVPFEKEHCQACWAGCCRLPVEVTSEELFHMGFVQAHEVEGPLKGVAKRLEKRGVIQQYFPRRRVFLLAQKKNSDCYFLDENRRCTVYENRPSICRQFPTCGPRPGFCPYRKFTASSSRSK